MNFLPSNPSLITKPLLASPLEDMDELFTAGRVWAVTPKLDGIRCMIVLLDGVKTAVSRNFKPIKNRHIRRWLETHCPVGFDGELMVRGTFNFQTVSSAVMSHDGEPDFEYWVFDYVTTSLTESYLGRVGKLEQLLAEPDAAPIRERVKAIVPELVRSQEELDTYEQWALSVGYEGVMLRTMHAPYKLGRSSVKEGYLLKLKRFEDSEAVIVEVKAKKHNTNEATTDELGRTKRSSSKEGIVMEERVGGFIVRDVKTGVEFNIGSGLNEIPGSPLNRDSLWAKRTTLPGLILKYKFQPTGVKEAPRFPIILGFRDAADMD